MPAFVLKALATVLTFATATLSAAYVTAHVKSSSAPLHPSVLGASQAAGGRLTLTPGVRTADVQAVTSTYAS